MDEATRNALETDRVVDITTIGRKTGEPKRIEIWIHAVNGTYFITGTPGTRSWYANLLGNPAITVHLKKAVKADLRGTAHPITDPVEREHLLTSAPALEGYLKPEALQEWVATAPMVRVRFD
ncbi:MAG TPA: nitroreductase/quinone reductase family protein [Tepidiformaceae bacterium]|nr:nitroreductase/quinone reductase family protein [Tepidiformaceae bacterium]